MGVDGERFRNALARVPTAVSVVTTVYAGHRYGMTVGSVCALSLTPPLVLFCLDRGSSTYRAFTTADTFLVNVLGDGQRDVAIRFATRGIERFNGEADRVGGLPTVSGALVHVLCARHTLLDGGDHTIVVGLVTDLDQRPGDPLLYYDRGFRELTRPLAATRK